MRFLSALLGAVVLAAACGGSTGSGSSDNSSIPPSTCMSPCNPGDTCLQAAEGNCNGEWYCWSDGKWYCAPPDASAPGKGGFDAAEIEASLLGEGTGDGGEAGPAAEAAAPDATGD